MKKYFFLLLLIFSAIFTYSQQNDLSFTNVDNKYEIQLGKTLNEDLILIITDNKNGSISGRAIVPKDASFYTFGEAVLKKINEITDIYYFKIPDTDFSIKIKKENLDKYDSINFSKLEKDIVIKTLEVNTIYSQNQQKLDTYLNSLNKDGDSLKLFNETNSINFICKSKGDSLEKELFFNNEPLGKTSEEFLNNLYANSFGEISIPSLSEILKEVILSKNEYEAISKLHFNELNRKKLEEIFTIAKNKTDYNYVDNVLLVDYQDNSQKEVFEVSIKNKYSSHYYTLKFCDVKYDCFETQKINYDAGKETFTQILNFSIKNFFTNDSKLLSEDDLNSLYYKCKYLNEIKVINDTTKPFKDSIASLIQKIEDQDSKYSGKLKLNKQVRVYDTDHEIIPDLYFIVDFATVRFFNNKAKEVVIIGKLNGKETKEFITLNIQYSLPLRSLNNSMQYVPISPMDDDAKQGFLNYNDLFQYYPYEGSYNYSVRDKEYLIKANDTVKIEERKLMDYFTAIIFSDFLGLNNKSANGLLQAEGRVKVPLWIRNWSYYSLFSAINAELNATIYNGFDDNSRFIDITTVGDTNNNSKSFLINNFDLIKYNNLNTAIYLDFAKAELKGLSTEWSAQYGLRYYRSGLRHTIENNGADIVTNYQINSLSHEIGTNFEIRPQLNFGADLNIAYSWLNYSGSNDDIDIQFEEVQDKDTRQLLRLQLNLYSKLNPDESNGGIYARLGGFYHLASKDFYPQILVGYATNLSSFVNKFKKD